MPAFSPSHPGPCRLRPALRALQLPTAFARRVVRGVQRRIEGRLGRRARAGALGILWHVAGALDERDRHRQGEWAAMAQDLTATTDRLALVESRVTAWQGDLAASIDASSQGLAALRARMAVLEYPLSGAPGTASTSAQAAASALSSVSAASSASAAPAAADADLTRYYLTLESVFRGDPSRIRTQLQADYLELLTKAREDAGDGPCIDLGCGRGEWLDLLREHGFGARGVELNPAMASVASASGHQVVLGDALAFLRGLPDDSLLPFPRSTSPSISTFPRCSGWLPNVAAF